MQRTMPYKDRKEQLQYQKEVRQWRAEHHICTRCGQNEARDGYKLCLMCAMDSRENRKKKVLTEEERLSRNLSQRLRKAEKRERNECVDCSAQRYKGHVYCYKHYIRQRQAQRRIDKQKFHYYKDLGLCRICGKEVATKPDGTKSAYCEQHYKEAQQRMAYAQQQKMEVLELSANKYRLDLLNNTKYSGTERWTMKVNKMSDRQVVAIWHRINDANEWVHHE